MSHKQIIILAGLCLASAGTSFAAPTVETPIGFSRETLEEHRIAGDDTVEVADPNQATFGGVMIRVTVAPDGTVIDARPERDAAENANPAAAVAAVRRWKFRPLTYRGRAVTAVGDVSIQYRLKGIWADRAAAFPAIDYANLKIELTRSACYGSCPDYKVTIDGAGSVVFSTRDAPPDGVSAIHRKYSFGRGVLVPGVHRTTIDRATLDALIAKFRQASFFGLKKEYFYPATDSSTQVLRFSTGGKTMEVIDYIGVMAGMPAEAKALEDAVDEAAGTARWVRGDAGTLAGLRAEGFDPKAAAAGDLAIAALGQMESSDGPARVVADLIAAGLPLDRAYLASKGSTPMPLGSALLIQALRKGQSSVARDLIARGWAAAIPKETLSATFVASGGGCEPDIARALVAAGADPKARSPRAGEDYEKGERTALMAATEESGICRNYYAPKHDLPALIPALVALGIDINARDSAGQTVLYGIEDPDLLEALLAAGARADVRDAKSLSPAFSTWTDAIVLRLLDAGADSSGRDDGLTLPQTAKKRDMPATLAWLRARGIR